MTLLLTTKAEIDDILSEEGVIGRLDDNETGTLSPDDAAMIDRMIEKAAVIDVGPVLDVKYATSDWQGLNPPTNTPASVRYMTAIVAARYVAGRRGLPAFEELATQYAMVKEWLADILADRRTLIDVQTFPSDATNMEPFVSNLSIDQRFRHSKARVVRSTTKGGPASRRQALEATYFTPWD